MKVMVQSWLAENSLGQALLVEFYGGIATVLCCYVKLTYLQS